MNGLEREGREMGEGRRRVMTQGEMDQQGLRDVCGEGGRGFGVCRWSGAWNEGIDSIWVV